MLRMTSSGTEAAMTAVRLARAATGRERVLKFAGAYHGHFDDMLAQAGSGLATQGLPSSPGVPASSAAGHDRRAVERSRGADGRLEANDLAAIIAEPLPANMGLVPPIEGFLEHAARASRRVRRAADPRRGDQRAARRARRRAGADRRSRGPDRDGQDHRRRAAGGRGRRPRGADARCSPRRARSTRRARCRATRWRSPPGWRRWRCSTSRLPAARGDHRAARRRAARGRRRVPRAGRQRARAADRVLHRDRRCWTSRTPRPATSTPTAAGAASCSRAASTRRRPSSRPGSRPWPTRPSRSSARSRPPPRPSRQLPEPGERRLSGCRAGRRRRWPAAAGRGPAGRGRADRRPARGRRARGGVARDRRRRGPARRRHARGVRAADRGDLRGLSAALRRPAPADSDDADLGLLAATGCTRSASSGSSSSATPRRGGARRHDLAERARAGQPATPSSPPRCGRPVRAPSDGAPQRGPRSRQGAVLRGLAGGDRGDAHKLAGRGDRALIRASILFPRCPTSTHKHKSKYTLDRGIPGAFEGETVTRRA